MNIQDLKQTVAYKAKQYKGTAKYLATNKATITTAVVAGTMLLAPEAMANDGTSDLTGLDLSDLSDKAVKYMREGGKAAFGVLGIGLTVVGGFKGYTMLKGGVRRA
ncbi:Uncharacterised protein [Moraxella caprae]|uniref:Uncharacterized protein n=1 Tax=Moraxella caprae TaxID=90240 RepID=A0A378QZ11_9GAMM|nr:hypothetical protein [Moraxella caprae]STZ08296.1 Uncharacterised protein [Moraxella caprae]